MSNLGDNISLPSVVSVDENSNKSSQDTSRRSQQWLEAEEKTDIMKIEFSDDDDEYELTRLTPSIEKAIRLSILSIGRDSDLDSGDDSKKNGEKQKKRKRDEVLLNESGDHDTNISDENSMDASSVGNMSYKILEPVKKKIKLEELDVPPAVHDKCAEILNNSQEIKNFLDEKPKPQCRKVLKVKLFKPDRKMQVLIKKALKRSKNNHYLSEHLENKENIGINNGIMIKSEPIYNMEVDSNSQQNNAEFIDYEYLEAAYSPESMNEDAGAISTRNDEPMEDRPKIKIETIKQEKEDGVDGESLPSVRSIYEVSSTLTPASSDVEMSEVDNQSDVMVREAAVQQHNLFDDGESSCFSSSDDSDYDNTSRFSDDDEQPDSILFARPTTSHSNQHLGERALETLQRQQELTMDRLQDLHGSLVSRPSDTDRVEDPAGLFTPLMLHQQQALAWLLWREEQKPPGGILADDMGLGKTLSMISLVLARYRNTQKKKKQKLRRRGRFVKYRGGTLVVCPASLLAQWQNEVFDHCTPGTLTVGIYHGPNRELSVKKLAKKDIIITTYNILAHASHQYDKNALFKIHWDRVILDEAHVIRNHKTRMCEAVCELVTDNRWALTGTPIHNKQMDLYSILKFLRCSPFDDLKIWRRWVDNRDEAGYRRLTTLMKTLLLRRTKKELIAKKLIQPLPDKLSQIIPIEMDPDERVVYEKVMIYSRTLFAQFLRQRAEKKRQMAFGAGYYRPVEDFFEEFNDAQKMLLATHADIQTTEILVLLTRLRQICCHPSLIHTMLDREDVQQKTSNNAILNFDLLNKINTFKEPEAGPPTTSTSGTTTSEIEIENLDEEEIGISKRVTENLLTRTNPVFNKSRVSSKHRAVLERIKEIIQNGNEKIIIVSQWTSHLKIIAENLKFIEGATYKSFDGSIPVKHRQQIVNELNTPDRDPRILLLSLTAGGVGLNLVGANHLMLVDIHWNPQLETQAQDRIYRFGQKKHVHVYRFICTDSIEERIKNLQEYKLDIAQNVLAGTGRVSTKLTLEDFKTLFGFN
ncbi:transcription termination factor 2-like [Chelonus insularis]|uniref:transcription termination factor 2-like n=1 Tax=Chelonus insularis TaxID=460826 RepID=UPI00158BD9CD|nr:transcription termination factor 2-like [Chelonus insularis]